MAGTNGDRKGPRRNSTGAGKPAWQRLTRKQRADFLERVAAGANRSQATAAVKAPAGSFRALCRHDPLFEADYQEARRAGRDPIAEKLRQRLVDAALDPEQKSSRFMQMALVLYDDEARVLIGRQRVEVTGKDGGPLEHRQFDPAKLSDEDLDKLDELLRLASAEE